MNLANKLTIFRIILVPIMVIIPFLGIKGEMLGIPTTFWIINLIFVIASITDKLDGYIARTRNQITSFGKFLDPIADKILVVAALTMLVEIDKIPAWIPIIIITREFIVSGYRLIAVEKGGQVIAASKWGKLKTVTQMIAIILTFLDKFSFGEFISSTTSKIDALTSSSLTYMVTGEYILNILSTAFLIIAVVATIFSGWDYIKHGKDLFKDK